MAVSERFQGANVIEAGRLSPYWGEHAARYVFALPFAEGREVLDIACGTGYGIGLLCKTAKTVTGVDIDAATAKQAKKECGQNGAVLLANGVELPFPDAAFDLVTSFETLEHLHERVKFIAELGRVLRPGGILILSTPNANYTQPINGVPNNKFHIHEYTPDELLAELGEHFVVEKFLGQTLDARIQISPFFEGQRRMPKDLATRGKLLGWKILNKFPVGPRESLSGLIWGRPFYPGETDYCFATETSDAAPVLVAVCQKET